MNQKQKQKFKFWGIIAALVIILAVAAAFIYHPDFTVLNPQGFIADQQRQIIVTVVALMLAVAIPMLAAAFFIAYTFRADRYKTRSETYNPDWNLSGKFQILWWMIPAAIIAIIGIITWKTAHKLDPYRPIDSAKKPITIQVVALRWKWLFIYPEQHIATVNLVEFPQQTPVVFQLTADAPMNSFWIPQLSGQIYAMAGMSTQLHIEADHMGEYQGSAAEINGAGFAGMKFVAKSVSQNDFDNWVTHLQQSNSGMLDINAYEQLSAPSEDNLPAYFSSVEGNLYNTIVAKFMGPQSSGGHVHH